MTARTFSIPIPKPVPLCGVRWCGIVEHWQTTWLINEPLVQLDESAD